ncbi:hypothetical protein HDU76_000060 [Blyttiomyces sp. JEL0837]|nr:hypothetical protein HDU76_000060 [Blyttiomyces sp. JEL0837]
MTNIMQENNNTAIVINNDQQQEQLTFPKTLTIAGSDSGGGAGIQADLKTFTSLKTFGTSVITAVTAQNTLGVQAVQPLSVSMIKSQIKSILSDIGTDAIKTGMLFSDEIIYGICDELECWRNEGVEGVNKLVVDPVMIATAASAPLIKNDAIDAVRKRLLPMAMVVTPNIPEAEVLAGFRDDGKRILDLNGMKEAAEILYGMGAKYVLIKGGHLPFDKEGKALSGDDEGGDHVVDILYDGKEFVEFRHRFVKTKNTHGTGCTLSAAIAAGLAKGMSVVEAVTQATDFVHGAVAKSFTIGKGNGPLNHFHLMITNPVPKYQISGPGGFVAMLKLSCRKEWDEYVNHPFVKGIQDGTLPVESHYARVYALASFKEHDMTSITRAAEIVTYIGQESKMHVKFCEKYNVTYQQLLETKEASPNLAYTRYVLEKGLSGDRLDLRVAVAPCLLGYGEIGRRLFEDPNTVKEGNPYYDWILNYSSESFQEAVREGEELMEKLAEELVPTGNTLRMKQLCDIFRQATVLEYNFWESETPRQLQHLIRPATTTINDIMYGQVNHLQRPHHVVDNHNNYNYNHSYNQQPQQYSHNAHYQHQHSIMSPISPAQSFSAISESPSTPTTPTTPIAGPHLLQVFNRVRCRTATKTSFQWVQAIPHIVTVPDSPREEPRTPVSPTPISGANGPNSPSPSTTPSGQSSPKPPSSSPANATPAGFRVMMPTPGSNIARANTAGPRVNHAALTQQFPAPPGMSRTLSTNSANGRPGTPTALSRSPSTPTTRRLLQDSQSNNGTTLPFIAFRLRVTRAKDPSSSPISSATPMSPWGSNSSTPTPTTPTSPKDPYQVCPAIAIPEKNMKFMASRARFFHFLEIQHQVAMSDGGITTYTASERPSVSASSSTTASVTSPTGTANLLASLASPVATATYSPIGISSSSGNGNEPPVSPWTQTSATSPVAPMFLAPTVHVTLPRLTNIGGGPSSPSSLTGCQETFTILVQWLMGKVTAAKVLNCVSYGTPNPVPNLQHQHQYNHHQQQQQHSALDRFIQLVLDASYLGVNDKFYKLIAVPWVLENWESSQLCIDKRWMLLPEILVVLSALSAKQKFKPVLMVDLMLAWTGGDKGEAVKIAAVVDKLSELEEQRKLILERGGDRPGGNGKNGSGGVGGVAMQRGSAASGGSVSSSMQSGGKSVISGNAIVNGDGNGVQRVPPPVPATNNSVPTAPPRTASSNVLDQRMQASRLVSVRSAMPPNYVPLPPPSSVPANVQSMPSAIVTTRAPPPTISITTSTSNAKPSRGKPTQSADDIDSGISSMDENSDDSHSEGTDPVTPSKPTTTSRHTLHRRTKTSTYIDRELYDCYDDEVENDAEEDDNDTDSNCSCDSCNFPSNNNNNRRNSTTNFEDPLSPTLTIKTIDTTVHDLLSPRSAVTYDQSFFDYLLTPSTTTAPKLPLPPQSNIQSPISPTPSNQSNQSSSSQWSTGSHPDPGASAAIEAFATWKREVMAGVVTNASIHRPLPPKQQVVGAGAGVFGGMFDDDDDHHNGTAGRWGIKVNSINTGNNKKVGSIGSSASGTLIGGLGLNRDNNVVWDEEFEEMLMEGERVVASVLVVRDSMGRVVNTAVYPKRLSR